MRFLPPCCPRPECLHSARALPPRWRRHGHYRRRTDDRRVPRFFCLRCRHTFSSQTFRLDCGLRKPWIDLTVVRLLCAKTTMRRSAEILGVQRRTVERRLDRFGRHCRALHEELLARHRRERGGLRGTFQLDELETFETDRRLQPVTVPVLIERHSYFVVSVATAPLPARGQLSEALRRRKKRLEDLHGRRRSGSRAAVERTLRAWREAADGTRLAHLQTDRKQSYRSAFRHVFGDRAGSHLQHSSKHVRDYRNLLFPINHTNAMLRDALSRLVRRTWAHSKRRRRLERHLWVFTAFRNYVRGITRRATRVTPAMALGVAGEPWSWARILRWKARFFDLGTTP